MKILNQIQRLFKRNKTTLIINIVGMTVGLSVTLLLALFINHELSYDKHFEHSDRIVRLKTGWENDGVKEVMPICLRKAYTELPSEIAGVEHCVQIFRAGRRAVEVEEESRGKASALYVDTDFLNLFERKIIESADSKTFPDNQSAMITESLAKQMFGQSTGVIGKPFTVSESDYTVSTVIEDYPSTTHFSSDVFLPMQSLSGLNQMQGLEFFTYYLLNEGVDVASVSNTISDKYLEILQNSFPEYAPQLSTSSEPLADIHMNSDVDFDLSATGSRMLVILLSIVATLIFFIAIFNSINLFALVGQNRTKEIAMKQISGATKRQITVQLLQESFIINLIALTMGVVLTYILLPEFNNLTSRHIVQNMLWSPYTCTIIVSILLISTVMSGTYPALLLAKENSISILKSNVTRNKKGRNRLSNVLLGIQILITTVVIFAMLAMNSQVNFVKHKPLGFNGDRVIQFYGFTNTLSKQYSTVKDELLSIPEVEDVTIRSHNMGGGYSGQGIAIQGETEKLNISINEYRVHSGFARFYEIPLVWGRYYRESDMGSRDVILVNEATAKRLGIQPNEERMVDYKGSPAKVIGVLKDFAYESAHTNIQPLAITVYSKGSWGASVRFKTTPTPEMITKVNNKLAGIDPSYTSNNASVKDLYSGMYYYENIVMKILAAACAVIVLICLMGLFAILIYDIRKRIKEFGVRKVMGASVGNIALVAMRRLMVLFGIVAVLLIPISILLFRQLMNNYAYQSSYNPILLLLAVLIPFVLVVVVVGSKAFGLINKNPVEALRTE